MSARFPDFTLHRLFEMQVERTPDQIALVFEGKQLTYRELNRYANNVAHRLISRGIKPEMLVGLAMKRSMELIVAILGIMKAGGAYVPLDPDYPKDRIQIMLEDCQAPFLVSQGDILGEFSNGLDIQTLNLDSCADPDSDFSHESDENPGVNVTPENLAYIIYTSGSTGRPKGTLTQHGNVVRLFNSADPLYGFNSNDIWTLFHSYAFDFSVWEIWGPLLYGGTLIIISFNLSRSPGEFYNLLLSNKVTVLNQTPSAFYQLMRIDQEKETSDILQLRYVILGGEALNFTALQPWFDRHGFEHPRLINGYGPTETTIFTTFKFINREDLQGTPVSNIGNWLTHLQIFIVDESLKSLPSGKTGEILIGGSGLSRGYFNRPELTAEKFIPNSLDHSIGTRLYRTGDLGRLLENGQLEYLGRIDQQVKLRGFRIELGEIEAVLLNHAYVREAAVSIREDEPGDKYLAAYIVPQSNTAACTHAALRTYLASKLPDYMIPTTLTELDKLPLSPNGKLDRNVLPKPEQKRPNMGQEYIAPTTDIEKKISSVWASLLRMDQVGIEDNFFDLGGNSLLCNQMVSRLKNNYGIELSIVNVFEHPTINLMAKFLSNKVNYNSANFNNKIMSNEIISNTTTEVAIIGMSLRFPGAMSAEEYWNNLLEGRESTSFFNDNELDVSVKNELRKDPRYVSARGVIEDIELFDAAFFGINPNEAEVMDPQHRVFLETSWEALENSGYGPDSVATQRVGTIGVYGGTYNNTYYTSQVITRPDLIAKVGEFQTMVANEKDYVATRVSHKLNLMGPSISLYTGCSTSLVAICQAYFALITHQCDMALAGGSSITVPQNIGHIYQEGSMLSSDGHCRPFDAKASGTVFSDGAGVVVLKRLEDALRDRDLIYGVIRGAAVNNDGSNRMSFTAPNVEGQTQVINAAQKRAGIHPDKISYVEAHGTATPMGDPIEVEALTKAFRLNTENKQFCAIGSVKSNFGHLTIAAGVAGLIKTLLALKNEVIPASINFETPNPNINFSNSPFYVASKKLPWPRSQVPRFAGVSAFGVGGTNAHVILQEPPVITTSSSSRPKQLLLLSAKSNSALEKATSNLMEHLQMNTGITASNYLADVAFTLQTGRKLFNYRRAIVCDTHDVKEASESKRYLSFKHESRDTEVVFMFPGQGSQHLNMGLNLYQTEPVFKNVVDQCSEILKPFLDRDLRDVLYPDSAKSEQTEESAEILRNTFFTQPAMFTIEYAMARLWMNWGVLPQTMVGHSIGEFVCACLSGVFSLEDALKLVATRGRLMQDLPSGAMLSVRLPIEEAEKLLTQDISIASVNSPSLCVLSGTFDAISDLQEQLESLGVVSRPLQTSHAFHSAMMDPIIVPFAQVVQELKLSPPSIPFVSTVTGTWITNQQATDPLYWAKHLRETVHFSEAVKLIWDTNPANILLEVGPRTTLTTLARQHAKDINKHISVASLSDSSEDQGEWTALLKAVGTLWASGITIDWDRFYSKETRHRVPLPTYPFDKKRFWADSSQDVFSKDMVTDESVALQKHIPTHPLHQMAENDASDQDSTSPFSPVLNTAPLSKSYLENVISQQIEIMSQQLDLIGEARRSERMSTVDQTRENI